MSSRIPSAKDRSIDPTSTFCILIGIDEPLSHTRHPEEMSEIVIQSVCQPYHASKIATD